MSKRVLYKPATTDKVVTREKRKPLAQGRLVTKPSGSVCRTSSPTILQQGAASDALKTSGYSQSHMQAREALSSPGGSHHRADDAPRRDQPHASLTQSPQRAEPSHALDLSDSESDITVSRRTAFDSNILMVDASRQTRGPNTSEVDIEIGHAYSPAKVICHAPSVVQSRLRNSGDLEQARKVTVDHIPSMNVLSYSDYTDPEAPRPMPTFKSPCVIRESTIAGSPIDRSSVAKPVVSKNLFAIMHDELKQSQPPRGYQPPRDMSMDNLSEASSFDSVTDITSDISTSAKTMSATTTEEQRKARKGAHYPTSRYLQTSTTAVKAKSKGPIKATDRTIMGPKNTSGNLKPKLSKRSSSATNLMPKLTGGISKYRVSAPEAKSGTTLKRKLSVGANVSQTTPQKCPQKPLSGKKSGRQVSYTTSTPTGADGDQSGPTSAVETSWQQGRSHLTPEVKGDTSVRTGGRNSSLLMPLVPKLTDDSKMSSIATVGSNDSRGPKAAEEINQLQLDMVYARYLQYVYLESRVRKSFTEQEKSVMADLYSMAELVSEKQKRKDELDHQLDRLRHVNKVDDALLLQEVGLVPVVAGLDQLSKQYQTLATSLDTTRHQLPTKGVHIPDNEDQFMDQLQAALNESEQLLGELSVMSRHKQPKVTAFAETLRTLDRTVNEQVSELAKCQESLAAATTLTVQECSLLIQDVILEST